MTTLTNKLLDPTGAPLVGAVVVATLVGGPFSADGTTEVVRQVSAATDGTGTWSMALTPTASIEGSSYYAVREESNLWAVTIPSSGTVQLRAALITAPTSSAFTPGLSKAQADTLYAAYGSGGGAGSLLAANNLSDLASAATARTNLAARGSAEKLTPPEQHGYLGESTDPACCNATVSMAAGLLYVVRIYIPKAATINTVSLQVVTAGSGLTAAQNLIGLYDDAGNLLSSCPDQAAAWASTGIKQAALAAGQAIAADSYVRVVLLSNGTTPPQLRAGSSSAPAASIAQSGSAIRFGFTGGGVTALPATITLSGLVAATPWLAVLT